MTGPICTVPVLVTVLFRSVGARCDKVIGTSRIQSPQLSQGFSYRVKLIW